MSQVVLEHITKFFVGPKGTRIQAVQDLSLTIDAGEFFVIAGPSGCGKTTLLRLIAGLETPEAGGISFGNRMATQLPLQERDVAMVFQQYALYPHMTAAQNIGFGLHLRKKSRTEIETRVLELGIFWEFATVFLGRRPNYPAANASAWRSLGPWLDNRAYSCWTNPFLTWIRRSGTDFAPIS